MPVVVSPLALRVRQAFLVMSLLALCVWGFVQEPETLYDKSCLESTDGVVVCAASEMARITRREASQLEHSRFDLRENKVQRLQWSVARNESIAFQLILRRADRHSAKELIIEPLNTTITTRLFQAHYVQIRDGGYLTVGETQDRGSKLSCSLSGCSSAVISAVRC